MFSPSPSAALSHHFSATCENLSTVNCLYSGQPIIHTKQLVRILRLVNREPSWTTWREGEPAVMRSLPSTLHQEDDGVGVGWGFPYIILYLDPCGLRGTGEGVSVGEESGREWMKYATGPQVINCQPKQVNYGDLLPAINYFYGPVWNVT